MVAIDPPVGICCAEKRARFAAPRRPNREGTSRPPDPRACCRPVSPILGRTAELRTVERRNSCSEVRSSNIPQTGRAVFGSLAVSCLGRSRVRRSRGSRGAAPVERGSGCGRYAGRRSCSGLSGGPVGGAAGGRRTEISGLVRGNTAAVRIGEITGVTAQVAETYGPSHLRSIGRRTSRVRS